ncbi:MAG TPA: class II aldolase/adducin family protein [Mycobacteriales bacterium]|jgi:ribulose-5-phosphate 4-epimerase/fuculose-1-phosphate aldolase|nr:class II aldolase/adducin family protein [Mycobacteriales bacterium]
MTTVTQQPEVDLATEHLFAMAPDEIPPVPAPSGFTGSAAEWNARVDLAACYRMVARYGWDDFISAHISARVPDEDDGFLINPFGLLFDEITASSLVKVNLAGDVLEVGRGQVNPAGFTIHSAVYQVRADVNAVVHLHTLDGMAVSTSAEGVLPLTQTAMTVAADVAYHDFEGPALDLAEREHLQQHLGKRNLMLLRNHGTLAVGDCVPTAFARIYALERACTVQVRALGTRSVLTPVDPDAVAKTFVPGAMEFIGRFGWPAVRRTLDRTDPSYRS